MVEMLPAYGFNCLRCKQQIFLNVTTLAYHGQRNFVLGSDINSQHAAKIYEIDLAVWELRMQGVNATPPGMNIQVLPEIVDCDFCKAQYDISKMLNPKRLTDSGAYNCGKCWCEQHTFFEVMEERDSALTLVAGDIVRAVQSGTANLESLMRLATSRILVAGQNLIALDRLSLMPDSVRCLYCGSDWKTKLSEPSPLIK